MVVRDLVRRMNAGIVALVLAFVYIVFFGIAAIAKRLMGRSARDSAFMPGENELVRSDTSPY